MNPAETSSRLVGENRGIIGVGLAYLVGDPSHTSEVGDTAPRAPRQPGNLSLLVSHPRPLVFVLSGIAIILGVPLGVWGYRRRAIYALGMALMAAYVVGYFAWHFTGHGGVLPVENHSSTG